MILGLTQGQEGIIEMILVILLLLTTTAWIYYYRKACKLDAKYEELDDQYTDLQFDYDSLSEETLFGVQYFD